MRESLKKIFIFKLTVLFARTLKNKHSVIKKTSLFFSFLKDYGRYKKLEKNTLVSPQSKDLFPRLYDNTKVTHVDPVYYIQGTWCAEMVFKNKPKHHYDIGSQALMVGIISKFTPTTMVDIRPLNVATKELSFIKGDILNLPFETESISSLSSICVIEHIGLGRYGDPLNQFGTEKAAKELSRVLSKDGNLYISVPVDSKNKVYFNAHRAFTREYVMSLFPNLELVEEKYIYGNSLEEDYSPSKGFGTGLYHFKK